MKNWKTRLSGILALTLIGLKAVHDPTALLDPATIAGVATSVGLIFAKQHNVTGGTVVQSSVPVSGGPTPN